MFLEKNISTQFNQVIEHVRNTHDTVKALGYAVLVIHNDQIVTEHYAGYHSQLQHAKAINEDSQFHIASVRKSYTGFCIAWALHYGYIQSIDDPVLHYLPDLDKVKLPSVGVFSHPPLMVS
ncbi:serine hydrolase [Bacillus chungangensis]|uniref:CubicO group peptidase (Beta-lactamase class C family) n=1 Tax=Bacillus chungangensis TaxID=587633 RepID=A0ABT9WV95_9BACI|nr:serine hydrolase domain-containing protein [Bacillus chungangensis]MDQ0177125.1 CubicO group peptidase (beta-lactamase class C family) [Bacillus chungangensis]